MPTLILLCSLQVALGFLLVCKMPPHGGGAFWTFKNGATMLKKLRSYIYWLFSIAIKIGHSIIRKSPTSHIIQAMGLTRFYISIQQRYSYQVSMYREG